MNYMSKYLNKKITRLFYKLCDFFPTSLPVGLTAYNNWCDRLLWTYFPENVAPPSEDSFRFSVAAMVMHLDAQKCKVPNRFFGKAIQKGAANEVASYVMQSLKAKRDAMIQAEQEAHAKRALTNSAEATATSPAEAPRGHPIQEV